MLKEGIYEQVINEDISKKLRDINLDKYILEKENIDVEEAKTILSNYISHVIKKDLRYIRESSKDSDREAMLSQIKAANSNQEIASISFQPFLGRSPEPGHKWKICNHIEYARKRLHFN